jgi:hypothetical protein
LKDVVFFDKTVQWLLKNVPNLFAFKSPSV